MTYSMVIIMALAGAIIGSHRIFKLRAIIKNLQHRLQLDIKLSEQFHSIQTNIIKEKNKQISDLKTTIKTLSNKKTCHSTKKKR